MAFSRDLPTSFREALSVCEEILSRNHKLVGEDRVVTEAEQIVVSAQKEEDPAFSRLALHSRISDRIQAKVAEQILIWAAQRAEGKPLQHLIGTQVFLDHEYLVGPDALVPRPETEVLVDTLYKTLKSPPVLGFEIGLGSGIISIELLSHYPALKMVGTEFSRKAYELAKRNAKWVLGDLEALRLEAIWVATADSVLDVFETFGKADFIISNPPYLAESDEIDEEVLKHEPEQALFPLAGGPNYFYEKIALKSREYLKPNGAIFLEIPHNRADQIRALFQQNNWQTELHLDLTQRQRVLVATHG